MTSPRGRDLGGFSGVCRQTTESALATVSMALLLAETLPTSCRPTEVYAKTPTS